MLFTTTQCCHVSHALGQLNFRAFFCRGKGDIRTINYSLFKKTNIHANKTTLINEAICSSRNGPEIYSYTARQILMYSELERDPPIYKRLILKTKRNMQFT